MIVFEAWPKIPRLTKNAIVTEKLDGTNACVVIDEEGTVAAQSRSRLLTMQNDNYGFAAWVESQKAELLNLGVGHHFGEWWGRGIGRKYNLADRRFSLFNVGRWRDRHGTNDHWDGANVKKPQAPACCYVVPVVAAGPIEVVLDSGRRLESTGSLAAPGFDRPEGFVVYLERQYFKVVFGAAADVPKSVAEAA